MPTIKQLLKQRGILQKQLALDLGVSQPTISDWINGKKEPTQENLKRLAEYFGVGQDEIQVGNTVTATFSVKNTNIPMDKEYSGLANAIVERLLDSSDLMKGMTSSEVGELAGLSPVERRLISAFRAADERAQRDAMNMLLSYPVEKEKNRA